MVLSTSFAQSPIAFRSLRRPVYTGTFTHVRRVFDGSFQQNSLKSQLASGRNITTRAVSVATPPSKQMDYDAPKDIHGFQLERQEFVKEYDSVVLFYKHKKTGAEVMSLINSDENKTFGATFRTPVVNSTGVPHILEHSVLCGSRKYPLKEPFVELMQGSLNTFLNAMTFPDRTAYPVASTNLQDYYNLVDVYLDAVLFPKCIQEEMTFQQEGWHYELDNAEDELKFKGVVYNEMKGVYSSPDQVNGRYILSEVFPDNNYAADSGGDPAVIPSLTFKDFQDFHGKYYHPSNGRFWFYGDDPAEKRLELLDGFLNEFEKREVDSRVTQQPLRTQERKVIRKYAAGEEQEAKSFVTVNWLLSDEKLDLQTDLAFGFLDYLLMGTYAAPLNKILNDSGLGESLIADGVESDLRQPMFTVGMKGVKEEDADKLEALIKQELTRLSVEGFPKSQVEAAINSIEFSLRENNTGSFPRGLSLMFRALSSWLYESDPLEGLRWEQPLRELKERIGKEDVFGPLIKKYLLDNTHKVTVVLVPDKKLSKEIEAQEKEKLKQKQTKMSEVEVESVVKSTEALKLRQETPDTPEAKKCMPTLKLEDIPREISTIPTEVSDFEGVTLLTHDLFTNDILYFDMAFDMSVIPEKLVPLLPLFSRSLTNMNTEKESFVELTERIDQKTGGLRFGASFQSKRGQEEPVALFQCSGKAMKDKIGDMMDLFKDILHTAKLDDQQRFKQMVLETKQSLETGIISGGHRYAAGQLTAQRSQASYLNDLTGGLSYLLYIRDLAQKVDTEFEQIKADLQEIRKLLLQRRGMIINVTGDKDVVAATKGPLASLLQSMPATAGDKVLKITPKPIKNIALLVPTQVNYVAKAANLYKDGDYELHGSTYVAEKLMGTSYLWEKIRVTGGAYGGFSSFDPHSGNYLFLSYRDPNLELTIKNYDGAQDYMKALELDDSELHKAIIGTIGDVDSYMLPDAKGRTAFSRYILGTTDEDRQKRRDQILNASVEDLRKHGEALEVVRGGKASVAVVTSKSALEEMQKKSPDFFDEVITVL